MPSLILHVGPPKCGSSSIENFFATQEKPCVQNTRYLMPDLSVIAEVNNKEPDESKLTSLNKLLLDNLDNCDALIFSHGALFQLPNTLKHISRMAGSLVTSISIVGYSRRQSDFFVSAYSQWSFRTPELVQDAIQVVSNLELDPALFSGLERQLIASIVKDFSHPIIPGYIVCDWYNRYKDISQAVSESSAVVKVGVLPQKGSKSNLIRDFCEKSGLTLRDEMEEASRQIVNVSFNKDIVEAINNGIVLGLDMVKPHDGHGNDMLDLLSEKINQIKDRPSEFLLKLKSYIDTYFINLNRQFCQEHGLNEDYFVSSGKLSKQDVLDIIIYEGQQRNSNKSTVIDNYRTLSAELIELCLKLVEGYDYTVQKKLPLSQRTAVIDHRN